MSDRKKDASNSQNETKPAIKKKYPFQTTRSSNSAKIKSESIENLKDEQGESKVETIRPKDSSEPEILSQIANDTPKTAINLLEIISEAGDQGSKDTPLRKNDTNNKNRKFPLESVSETLRENEIELNLVEVAEKKETRQKVTSKDLTEKEIDEICGERNGKGKTYTKTRTPGVDPRFQQQNQTLRCYVMYTDFYRCENILGKGELACQWFKDVFTSICPLDWIRRWDEAREEGRLGWTKGRKQGKFPGNRYGD